MIPALNRKPMYEIKIPELSGGINLRDGISLVNDNQMTDANNMWYSNGILRTRPKVIEKPLSNLHRNERTYLNSVPNANKTMIDGKEYYLDVAITTLGVGGLNHLCTRFLGKDNDIFLPEFSVDYTIKNVLPITHNGNVYLYVHGYDANGNRNHIYVSHRKSEGIYEAFAPPADGEIYSPIVMTNVWSSYRDGGDSAALMRKGTTLFEGFNLLGNRYRMQGSLYDASELGEIHVMDSEDPNKVINTISYLEFSVPFTPNNLSYDGVIRLEYTDIQGVVHIHSVYCPKKDSEKPSRVESEESHNGATDGYYLHSFVCGDIVHISLNTSNKEGDNEPDYISRDKYVNNNMMIYAPCETSNAKWEKITAMSRAVWYGNTSLGINGGSRLFLGANVKDEEKA